MRFGFDCYFSVEEKMAFSFEALNESGQRTSEKQMLHFSDTLLLYCCF